MLNPFKLIDDNNLLLLKECYIDIMVLDYAIVHNADPLIIRWLCKKVKPTVKTLDLSVIYSMRHLPFLMASMDVTTPIDKLFELDDWEMV